MPYFNQLLFQ